MSAKCWRILVLGFALAPLISWGQKDAGKQGLGFGGPMGGGSNPTPGFTDPTYSTGNNLSWQSTVNSPGFMNNYSYYSNYLEGCPFASQRDDRLLVSNVMQRLSELSQREGCQVETSGSPQGRLTSTVTTARTNQSQTPCQDLQRLHDDYNTQVRELNNPNFPHAQVRTLAVPFSACVVKVGDPPSAECVERVYEVLSQRLSSQCARSIQNAEETAAQRAQDEMTILATSQISRAIANPNCTSNDLVQDTAQLGIRSLSTLSTAFPGYTIASAVGAELLSSILQRITSSDRNGLAQLQQSLQEEDMRCLVYEVNRRDLNCPGDRNRRSQPSYLLDEAFTSMYQNLSQPQGPNYNLLLSDLESTVSLPDGTTSTLREVMRRAQNHLSQQSDQVSQMRATILQQMLAIGADPATFPQSRLDLGQISWGLAQSMSAFYPDYASDIQSAFSQLGTTQHLGSSYSYGGGMHGNSQATNNKILNEALGALTVELSKNQNYQIRTIESRSRLAQTSSRPEMAGQNLTDVFRNCAFNAPLLLIDGRRHERVIRQNAGALPDSYESITQERLDSYNQLCRQFSCVLPRLASPSATAYQAWQCEIFSQQAALQSRFTQRLAEWQADRSQPFCATSTSTTSPQRGAPGVE